MSENKAIQIKKLLEDQCMLFTDLHIGIRTDSENWFKTALEYSEWVKQEALKHNVNTLIFLGDFFHDREEIRITALDAADKFLANLKQFNIILMVGNHDCLYKDNADIHSLSIFHKWSNIVVVDSLEIVEYMDKKIAFMPWGVKLEDVPDGLDYIFGHLEVESFMKNKVKMCDHGFKSSDLLAKAKHVYSGHFHLRSKKKYSNGTITYVGCTFQQDWGDYEEEKGIELLTLSTGKSVFIPNTVSPRYVKVHLSKLLSKDKDEIETVKTKLKNNIVKLIVDQDMSAEKLSALSEKLSSLMPMEFNSEVTTGTEVKSADDFTSVEIDLKLLLTEFIEKLEIPANKDKILEETLNIHAKALSKIKDDTNE